MASIYLNLNKCGNNFCYAKNSVDIALMIYDWRTADGYRGGTAHVLILSRYEDEYTDRSILQTNQGVKIQKYNAVRIKRGHARKLRNFILKEFNGTLSWE